MDRFAVAMRVKRQTADLTLRDLGKKLGLSHVFISEVERGLKDMPRKYWSKLAKAIDVDVEDLEKWDEENWCPSCERRIPPRLR